MDPLVKILIERYGLSEDDAVRQARLMYQVSAEPEAGQLLQRPKASQPAKPAQTYTSSAPATFGEQLPIGRSSTSVMAQRQQIRDEAMRSLHTTLVSRGVDPAAAADVTLKLLGVPQSTQPPAPAPTIQSPRDYAAGMSTPVRRYGAM